MKNVRLAATLAATALVVCATAAFAQSGTVNAYSGADEAKAKSEVQAAGFTPVEVVAAQAGNLFVKATKGGDDYVITVTPDGHVYPSVPSHPAA